MKLNAIKQMETYARYHPDVVSLSQGIPFLNSDPTIRYDAINALLQNKVDRYSDPQGIKELRTMLSFSLADENMHYTSDEILITAGVTEALSATLLTILSAEQNEVLVPTPTYSAYFRIISLAKGKCIPLPLLEEKHWELDLALLEKNITNHTAAILLCNPNNPTGALYSREILENVCEIAQKYNLFVILDEVYKNMLFGDVAYYSPAVDRRWKKTVIRVMSFSKDFSLTGWRVGFLHADASIIKKILPVHDALINCVPVISQYAAMSAIENQEKILADNRIIYAKQRDLIASYLDKLSEDVSYVLPKGSYFFFPRLLKIKNVEKFCQELLRKENVAVVPGNDFGPGGENHVRICFGRKKSDIEKGMEGLTRYIKSINY